MRGLVALGIIACTWMWLVSCGCPPRDCDGWQPSRVVGDLEEDGKRWHIEVDGNTVTVTLTLESGTATAVYDRTIAEQYHTVDTGF